MGELWIRKSAENELFFLCDQRIKLRDFRAVASLLVLARAEQIDFVLRPPALEKEEVLRESHRGVTDAAAG